MKKLLIAVLTFCLLAVGALAYDPQDSAYYSDMSSNHRYFNEIEEISDLGIVSGYPDGTYQPDRVLNRAELLKIIVEAVYVDEFEAFADTDCFPDVPVGEWFTQYVCFAESVGIVDGHADGTFKPADEIILVEAVKIAMEGFGYSYPDTEPWYKGPIDAAADIQAIPEEFTSFTQKMNRGQMADMIVRILDDQDGISILSPDPVDFDSLAAGEDKDTAVCNTGEGYYLDVDMTYVPFGDCNTFTCQADGSFDSTSIVCANSFIYEVCGAVPAVDGDTVSCGDNMYSCNSASEVTYGGFDFVQCNITNVEDKGIDPLVSVGGMLDNGYNLLGEAGGSVYTMDNNADLIDFMGVPTNTDEVRDLAMAVTGLNAASSIADLEELYEGFELALGPILNFSDAIGLDEHGYHVYLYYKPFFGCAPFPVTEQLFFVDEGVVTFYSAVEVGQVDNGICVD